MAELAPETIRIIGEELKKNTDDLVTAVGAVETLEATWVFGDEEVLPTSAALKAALAAYEALSPAPMSIEGELGLVRAWEA
jgi:hypothetical protein